MPAPNTTRESRQTQHASARQQARARAHGRTKPRGGEHPGEGVTPTPSVRADATRPPRGVQNHRLDARQQARPNVFNLFSPLLFIVFLKIYEKISQKISKIFCMFCFYIKKFSQCLLLLLCFQLGINNITTNLWQVLCVYTTKCRAFFYG